MKKFNPTLWFGFLTVGLMFFSSCQVAQQKKITIVYTSFEGRDRQNIVNESIQLFEKAHPDVEIKTIYINASQYTTKIQTMIAAGTAPDVMQMFPEDLPSFAKKGTLLNLEPYLKRDNFNLDIYFPNILEAYKYRGRVYGLPQGACSYLLYYNKDLFDQAGVQYPDENWTWDSFLDACQRLTRDIDGDGRIDQYGFTQSTWIDRLLVWIRQNGGDYLNEDRTRCVINAPEAKEAIQFVIDLWHKYHVAPTPAMAKEQGVNQMFETGRVAIFLTGGWMIPVYKKTIKAFDWDIAPLPKGKRRANVLLPGGCVISQQSRHPEYAWEFLKYVTGLENKAQLMKLEGFLPALKSIADSEEFLISRYNRIHLRALEDATTMPYIPKFREMANGIIARKLESACIGQKSIDKVCQEIKKEVDELLGNK